VSCKRYRDAGAENTVASYPYSGTGEIAMFDQYDYQQYGTTTAAPKYTKQNEKPMPGREELLARKSFPSVNDNKYLNRIRYLNEQSRCEEYERRVKEWD
jgi:hypothetical protein